MEFKIYIYVKPTGEHLVYRTFDAAERACREGGRIEEWSCVEDSDRLVLTRVWERVKGQLIDQGIGTS
jgi:hypothetical protein